MWKIFCKSFSTIYNNCFSPYSKRIVISYSNKHIFKRSNNISLERKKSTQLLTYVLYTGIKINILGHTMDLYMQKIYGYSFHIVNLLKILHNAELKVTVCCVRMNVSVCI